MARGLKSLDSNQTKVWGLLAGGVLSRTFQGKALKCFRFLILLLSTVVFMVSRKRGWDVLCHNGYRRPRFKSKLNPMRN